MGCVKSLVALDTKLPSATSAAAGTQITLTATPSEGYRFAEWEIVSGGVTIVDNKLAMPANNVTVKAIFEPETQQPTTYEVTIKKSGVF